MERLLGESGDIRGGWCLWKMEQEMSRTERGGGGGGSKMGQTESIRLWKKSSILIW